VRHEHGVLTPQPPSSPLPPPCQHPLSRAAARTRPPAPMDRSRRDTSRRSSSMRRTWRVGRGGGGGGGHRGGPGAPGGRGGECTPPPFPGRPPPPPRAPPPPPQPRPLVPSPTGARLPRAHLGHVAAKHLGARHLELLQRRLHRRAGMRPQLRAAAAPAEAELRRGRLRRLAGRPACRRCRGSTGAAASMSQQGVSPPPPAPPPPHLALLQV